MLSRSVDFCSAVSELFEGSSFSDLSLLRSIGNVSLLVDIYKLPGFGGSCVDRFYSLRSASSRDKAAKTSYHLRHAGCRSGTLSVGSICRCVRKYRDGAPAHDIGLVNLGIGKRVIEIFGVQQLTPRVAVGGRR